MLASDILGDLWDFSCRIFVQLGVVEALERTSIGHYSFVDLYQLIPAVHLYISCQGQSILKPWLTEAGLVLYDLRMHN